MAYDNYTYVNTSGIIVPDTSAVQEQVVADFKTALGQDLDTTPETSQGRLIQLTTDYRVNTLGINAQNANQINLRYATGRFLDAIGAFFGLQRISATPTRVLATLTGTPNTVILAGAQAQSEAGDIFYLENNTTIPNSGNIDSFFISEQVGQIPCEVDTLNKIISQQIGWETINNNSNPIIGLPQESDNSYRVRIEASRFKGISLMRAIKSKLANIPNVLSSFARDNGEKEPIVYDSVTIDGNSIVVVVDGGSDNDVANAIYQAKTGGAGYTAIPSQSTVVTVTDGAYGVNYPITFNRPSRQSFDVNITVKNVNYTGTSIVNDVKNAILDWASGDIEGVDGVKIGQSVSPFEISAAVSQVIPTIYIKNCLICLHGGTPIAAEIPFTISQIGELDENNITVVVV